MRGSEICPKNSPQITEHNYNKNDDSQDTLSPEVYDRFKKFIRTKPSEINKPCLFGGNSSVNRKGAAYFWCTEHMRLCKKRKCNFILNRHQKWIASIKKVQTGSKDGIQPQETIEQELEQIELHANSLRIVDDEIVMDKNM